MYCSYIFKSSFDSSFYFLLPGLFLCFFLFRCPRSHVHLILEPHTFLYIIMKSRGAHINSRLPGYSPYVQMVLQGPCYSYPPTHSGLPLLYPAPVALFADNLIVKAVMDSIEAYKTNWRISHSCCQLLMTFCLLRGSVNTARVMVKNGNWRKAY